LGTPLTATPCIFGSPYHRPRGFAPGATGGRLANRQQGVLSDPAHPTLLGTCDTPGMAMCVAISGDHAFVADNTSGLQVIQMFQSEVDPDRNIGRSLFVNAVPDSIIKARLATVQTNTVTWELSADGGANWQAMAPDGSWNQMDVRGTDLLWRSTHTWASPGVNPGVTGIEIDWLLASAPINSIVDVPGDQRRSVNLSFTRSAHDLVDEAAFPVVGYAVYRRLDDAALAQQVRSQPAVSRDEVLDQPQFASFSPDRVRRLADRTFIVGSSSSAVGTLPPGVWEGVSWMLPSQSDAYTLRVNTLVDSTAGGPGCSVFGYDPGWSAGLVKASLAGHPVLVRCSRDEPLK